MRDANEELKKRGVKVFGVSCDGVDAQKSFADKQELPYDLIADVDGKVCEAFGVPVRGGRFASRQAFLFKDGQLVWRDLKAKTTGQAADVLKVIGE